MRDQPMTRYKQEELEAKIAESIGSTIREGQKSILRMNQVKDVIEWFKKTKKFENDNEVNMKVINEVAERLQEFLAPHIIEVLIKEVKITLNDKENTKLPERKISVNLTPYVEFIFSVDSVAKVEKRIPFVTAGYINIINADLSRRDNKIDSKVERLETPITISGSLEMLLGSRKEIIGTLNFSLENIELTINETRSI